MKTSLRFILLTATHAARQYYRERIVVLPQQRLQYLLHYIYSPTNVQFNHINYVISLSYMFRTLKLGSSSGTHYLKSHIPEDEPKLRVRNM
jgi:hypothetical protein